MITIKWILLIALFKCSHQQSTTSLLGCSGNRECVRFFNCSSFITDDDGLIDLYGVEPECPHYLDVCCSKENKSETPTIITKPITGKCGASNPNGVGFKVQQTFEHEAQFGEYPWMVAVLRKEKVFGRDQNMYHCGGSLIHPSVVLTIGHKVVDVTISSLFVRAGEWNTENTSESFPFVESNVTSIDIHPRFHPTTSINNIALLFLETPIMKAQHINTICLPPPHMNFDGQRCFVSGWGKNNLIKETSYQHILKKIELSVIDHENCTEKFRKTRLGNNFILNESFICAGSVFKEGKTACKGDEGSPLVCPIPGNEGHFYQAGIVAGGIECGENDIPGAFTNVPFFADWIEEELTNSGYIL